jgi:hypothetical protein
MGQVFIFIILGQRSTPKVRLRLSKTMYCCRKLLQEADALFKTILTPETLQAIVNLFLWNGWTGKIQTKVLMQFEKSIFSFIDAPASFSNFH